MELGSNLHVEFKTLKSQKQKIQQWFNRDWGMGSSWKFWLQEINLNGYEKFWGIAY